MVAAVAIVLAAIGGIAAIQGWLPAWGAKDEEPRAAAGKTRITGTAPPETLSPGESVVTGIDPKSVLPPATASAPPSPAIATPPSPVAPAPAPAREAAPRKKAAPSTPSYAPPPPPPRPTAESSRDVCTNCGVVTSTLYRDDDVRGGTWEVRVNFDDGSRRVLRYPTHPRFQPGDRVFLSRGRLHLD